MRAADRELQQMDRLIERCQRELARNAQQTTGALALIDLFFSYFDGTPHGWDDSKHYGFWENQKRLDALDVLLPNLVDDSIILKELLDQTADNRERHLNAPRKKGREPRAESDDS